VFFVSTVFSILFFNFYYFFLCLKICKLTKWSIAICFLFLV